MKVSKNTIIRLIAVLIVIGNLILKAFGKSPIDVDESTIGVWVETILEIAVIVVAFWKNNSFSQAAIKADAFLRSLRSETGAGGTMHFSEFVNTYLGKSTDWDGAYGTQCVDLIKAYLYECFGIKAGSWGNAKYYWLNFNLHSALKNNFNRIAYTKGMQFKAGDIVVWNAGIGSSGCGHIAIATGEYNSSGFYTYDQNWNGKNMKKVKHSYSCVYGVLRPKDQSKTEAKPITGTGSFPKPVKWRNGNTSEAMYAANNFTNRIMNLGKKVSAWCYSKAGSAYLIVATFDGGKHATAGFVGYAGGLTSAPPESKVWKNGSSAETVYADVDKTIKVGTLSPYESCYCLGKIDGMYLVLYKVSGSNIQKCGFVKYNGGVN